MAGIPKKIHWIWFGKKPLSEKTLFCLESWKKILPDYEIIKWNEDNFDISCSPYASAAYKAKQYAFVSDIARFIILKNHGGIYLDTDVEVLKPLDSFLDNDVFMSFKDSRTIFGVTSSIVGAKKNSAFLSDVITHIEDDGFVPIGNNIYKTVSYILVDEIKKRGIKINNQLQTKHGLTLYPLEFLSPKLKNEGDIVVTENTHAIHFSERSWITAEMLEEYSKKAKENPELFKQG